MPVWGWGQAKDMVEALFESFSFSPPGAESEGQHHDFRMANALRSGLSGLPGAQTGLSSPSEPFECFNRLSSLIFPCKHTRARCMVAIVYLLTMSVCDWFACFVCGLAQR